MSESLRRPLQALFLTLMTVFLSLTTVIVATVPLLVLRRDYGRLYFAGLVSLATVILFFSQQSESAIVLIAAFLLVAVYVEASELGMNHLYSAGVSVLFVVGSLYCTGHFWLRAQGSNFRVFFSEKVDTFSKQLAAMDPSLKVDVNTIVAQTPSAMVILLAVSIWLAMLWEARMSQRRGVSNEGELFKNETRGLENFQVPEWFVWIFLASVVGTFLDVVSNDVLKVVATNMLNISIMLYFFQGIAVVGMFFRKQKMGPFWQALGYLILIAQLFLFVAMIGFVDLWIDFRAKMMKKSEQRTGEV